jgi:hypothetical protein
VTRILSLSNRAGVVGENNHQPGPLGATRYNSAFDSFSPMPLSRHPTGEHHACLFSSRLEPPAPWFTGWRAVAWDVFAIISWFAFVAVTGVGVLFAVFVLLFCQF